MLTFGVVSAIWTLFSHHGAARDSDDVPVSISYTDDPHHPREALSIIPKHWMVATATGIRPVQRPIPKDFFSPIQFGLFRFFFQYVGLLPGRFSSVSPSPTYVGRSTWPLNSRTNIAAAALSGNSSQSSDAPDPVPIDDEDDENFSRAPDAPGPVTIDEEEDE